MELIIEMGSDGITIPNNIPKGRYKLVKIDEEEERDVNEWALANGASKRLQNILRMSKYKVLADLEGVDKEKLYELRGLGTKTIEELVELLEASGISVKP